MVKYYYTSNFASQIEGMIEQKHSLGYPYEENSRILKNFDIFCQTKFPNENILTKELCLSWAIKRDSECAIMPERTAFFPESNGNIYTKKWAEKTFRVQWAKTNIVQTSGNIPRIYDFRHTFATHRLYQWMKEGKDLTAFLPYLSSYLGHAQLSDTAYYIHLVPGIFNEMTEFDISKREDLLPEVTL